MRRGGTLLLALLLFSIGVSMTANCHRVVSAKDERSSVLAALARLFGPSNDTSALIFTSPQYRIAPAFSSEGVLISLRIDANTSPSHSDFSQLLNLLDSVKPLGKRVEDMGATFVHGGKGFSSRRYENAYVETETLFMTTESPRPVQSSIIYYLHQVTGTARLPKGSGPPTGSFSFGLICIANQSYIAPNAEYMKVWIRPNESQELNVAGPTLESVCTE